MAALLVRTHQGIYCHFTCDGEPGPVQWGRAQPPFSFLSLTAVDEILQLAQGARMGPFFLAGQKYVLFKRRRNGRSMEPISTLLL
jgi:hypothetical protein